jgi:alkylation response protein AidB-like acyl-CoA dehydrogenase
VDELETFRTELSAWLEANAPRELRGRMLDVEANVWGGRRPVFHIPESKRWLGMMAERGFTAPTWPREYGGAGLDKAHAKVIENELRRLKMPPPLVGFGLTMIGPTLLDFGSDAQKREHLPRIARGEIRWCQGYSEPHAGSDLASLRCSAVRDNDEFVINGQKTWTSYGDQSDWMFLLVRTDPKAKKQQGISFVLLDLATPGVTIRPIRLISGASPFCETFLQDVRIPVTNVVSEINGGWTVAKALLGHERGMIASVFGEAQRSGGPDIVLDVARRYLGDSAGRIGDPVLRERVVALLMDQLAFSLTVQRGRDGARAGQRPGPESSILKITGTELNQRRQELLVALRGPQALGWEGAGFEADELSATRDWLRSRGNTIEGGTSEIQLNIIAKQVLGLPD